MRDFRVVDKGDGTYINISQNQRVNEKIKKLIGLTNLDALYQTEKEIENIFEFTMLIDDWVLCFWEKRRKSGTMQSKKRQDGDSTRIR